MFPPGYYDGYNHSCYKLWSPASVSTRLLWWLQSLMLQVMDLHQCFHLDIMMATIINVIGYGPPPVFPPGYYDGYNPWARFPHHPANQQLQEYFLLFLLLKLHCIKTKGLNSHCTLLSIEWILFRYKISTSYVGSLFEVLFITHKLLKDFRFAYRK